MGGAHFERGKLWLRLDDMERASESFRAAAARMPRFGSAWANLGATLGELDRPDEALEAFDDGAGLRPVQPSGAQQRRRRSVASWASWRSPRRRFAGSSQLAPDLAFGYYNLGHTLFLQGRYQAALAAYAEGQKRDPERNPVQASRLAMCRLATGRRRRRTHASCSARPAALPREYRQQLLADTHTIAWALLTHRPDLPGWQQVNDWLTRTNWRA